MKRANNTIRDFPFLLLLFLLLAVSACAQNGVVVAEQANLRTKPSVKSKIVARLPRGEALKLDKESGDWYRVRTKRHFGWLHKSALATQSVIETPPESVITKLDFKSLAGTTWSGKDSDGDYYVFMFEPDGTAAYTSPTGSYRNGKWNQFENTLYIQMNDHYSEYLGRLEGNTIKGRAWNKTGRKWLWEIVKK